MQVRRRKMVRADFKPSSQRLKVATSEENSWNVVLEAFLDNGEDSNGHLIYFFVCSLNVFGDAL